MVINKSNCKECIKNDVCGIRDGYDFAVEAISSTNTTNQDRTIYEARLNPNIQVCVSCPKFMQIPVITR